MARLADYFVLVAFGPHPRGECRARGRGLRAEGRSPETGKGQPGRQDRRSGAVAGTCEAGGPRPPGQHEGRPEHLPGWGRGSGRGGLSEDSRAVRHGEPNLPITLRTEPGQAELWRGPGRWEGPEKARPPGSQLGGMGPLCLGRLPGSSASRGTDISLASPSFDPRCLWSGASALPVWDVSGPGGMQKRGGI